MPDRHRAPLSLRAQRELNAAIRWIARDNRAAARALAGTARTATEHIAAYPHMGRIAPEIAREPYRLFPLKGFPYLLVYNPERDPPAIVRIVHGARDLPEVLSDL